MREFGSSGGETAQAGGDRAADTVLHALRRAVEAVPDEIFLDFDGDTFTFAETDRLSTRLAHELVRLGVGPGGTVATILDNSMDQIVSWLAINKAGGVWVPLNTAYRGEFLRHQLHDSLTSIVIADRAYVGNVAQVSHDLTHLKLILRRGSPPEAGDPQSAAEVAPLDAYRGTDDTPCRWRQSPATCRC